VWRQLARLTPRDRELLLLAYVEGLTHQEIAEVTGLMRASVRPLLFRARQRFASVLRHAGLAPDAIAGGAR
jgi:RNA polymerase sigma-70 factor (ECF subfamily)